MNKQQERRLQEAKGKMAEILRQWEPTVFSPYSSSVLEANIDQILNLRDSEGPIIAVLLPKKQQQLSTQTLLEIKGILDDFFPYMGKKDRRNEAIGKLEELISNLEGWRKVILPE